MEGRTAQEALAALTEEGANRMFPGGVPPAYRKQIDHELRLIGALGYAPYFLTVNAIVAESRRRGSSGNPHWLAVCDIDHFKQVNDNFGHLIGDEVLIMLAQVMRQSFRFDDQLFRFGGEEFIALLKPATEADALATLECRTRQVVPAGDHHVLIADVVSIDLSEHADPALLYFRGRYRTLD